MQDKDTTKSTFDQLFKPINNKIFSQQLAGLEVDKYAKKLKTQQLIELVAHAQLKQQKSLRDISNSFNEDEFSQAINLDSISASQISRRLKDLPLEAVQLLLKSNILEVGKEIGFDAITRKIGRIYLIDSSTITLCLSQYQWAEFRNTKGGIKLPPLYGESCGYSTIWGKPGWLFCFSTLFQSVNFNHQFIHLGLVGGFSRCNYRFVRNNSFFAESEPLVCPEQPERRESGLCILILLHYGAESKPCNLMPRQLLAGGK
jgi:hypothetical protein